MHSKICTIDLKSGILCPKCEEKVKSGEVSDLDLKVAKVLLSLESKYPALQDAYFHRAIEADDTLVILFDKKDVSRILSYGGKLLKDISERTGKRWIRIIAYNADKRRLLEELFAPASILTVNTLWLPDGSTETKVVLSGNTRRLPIRIATAKDIVKNLMNISLRVEFEEGAPPAKVKVRT